MTRETASLCRVRTPTVAPGARSRIWATRSAAWAIIRGRAFACMRSSRGPTSTRT